MSKTINTNMFSITKNKFKKEGTKMPDYKLSVRVESEFIEVGAAWMKESASGAKYISVMLAEGLNITGTVVPYQKKTPSTPTQAEMDF